MKFSKLPSILQRILLKRNLQFCLKLHISMIIHISAIGWSFFINFPINDRELLIQRWQTQIFEHCQVNPQTRGIIRFQNDIYMQLAPHILRDNNNIRLSLRFFPPRHDWRRIKRSPPVRKRRDECLVDANDKICLETRWSCHDDSHYEFLIKEDINYSYNFECKC